MERLRGERDGKGKVRVVMERGEGQGRGVTIVVMVWDREEEKLSGENRWGQIPSQVVSD